MPVPRIFDFDQARLEGVYHPERIDKILSEQPALYVNHLRIAASIQGWAERAESDLGGEYGKGYAKALREVAAHLRVGDYVEGVEGGSMIHDSDTRTE